MAESITVPYMNAGSMVTTENINLISQNLASAIIMQTTTGSSGTITKSNPYGAATVAWTIFFHYTIYEGNGKYASHQGSMFTISPFTTSFLLAQSASTTCQILLNITSSDITLQNKQTTEQAYVILIPLVS